MHDRPTYDELLAAVERFLRDDVMPNISGARSFHARVAANVVGIVRRELANEDEALAAEWAGLDALLGDDVRPPTRAALREAIATRTAALCERIRAGDADPGPFRDAALAHVRHTVRAKLLASNPGWLKHEAD
jgi:hypothetical protein